MLRFISIHFITREWGKKAKYVKIKIHFNLPCCPASLKMRMFNIYKIHAPIIKIVFFFKFPLAHISFRSQKYM